MLLLQCSSSAIAAAATGGGGGAIKGSSGKRAGNSSSSSGGGGAGVVLRLIPVIAPDAFPLGKLAPTRNNVRWVAKEIPTPAAAGAVAGAVANGAAAAGHGKKHQQQQQPPEDLWLPTPHYNAVVLRDMLAVAHQERLQQAVQQIPGFKDALLLLKVWAVQCGMSTQSLLYPSGSSSSSSSWGCSQSDGFSGHLLTLLLVVASERAGATAAIMTPLQLFRSVLQLLGDRVAWSKGVVLARVKAVAVKGGLQQQQMLALTNPPAVAAFKKQYAVVLLDHTGWYNAAAAVSASCLGLAAAEAQRSLGLLGGKGDPLETFGALLCTPRYADGMYDYVWHVTLPEGEGGKFEGDLSQRRQEELRVEGLVRTALGDRALLVRALPRAGGYSSSSSSHHTAATTEAAAGGGAKKKQKKGAGAGAVVGEVLTERQSIFVGAFVDAQKSLRLVDVGPAANDTAAAEKFRGIWGEKSELRRFQDGKICEAVVWEVGADARHRIPDLAVGYILRRHLPPGVEVIGCAGEVDDVLCPNGDGGDTVASRSADAALTKLSKQLRGLTDLALKVVGVQPLSGVSRHTPGFYPRPHPLAGGGGGLEEGREVARCLEPLEVMVQLEGTGEGGRGFGSGVFGFWEWAF